MFNVSIREYFSLLNVFIVCICNTAKREHDGESDALSPVRWSGGA